MTISEKNMREVDLLVATLECLLLPSKDEKTARVMYAGAIDLIASTLQRRDDEIEALKIWKAEAKTVMGELDIQAIGKHLRVPFGVKIADKILPALKRKDDQMQKLVEALKMFVDYIGEGEDFESTSAMGAAQQALSEWEAGK